MVELTREEYNLIVERRGVKKPQNMSSKKLINTFNRYDGKRKTSKLSKIRLGKVVKMQLLVVISLLKSESSDAERNYMKHFNNNINDDDDTYDEK